VGYNHAPNAGMRGITKQLTDERKKLGLTIEDVSDKAGYAVDHFKKLECGRRNPSFGMLTAWANTLGYDVECEIILKKRGP